jgi:uncharacterized protein YvpB
MMIGLHLFVSFLLGASAVASGASINATTTANAVIAPSQVAATALSNTSALPSVPFYSQFQDIGDASWQKIGCGVTSLAMIVNFYHPGAVSVETLLDEGVASGAYINGAGWSHLGLVRLGEGYGLKGETYDLSKLDTASALLRLETALARGPVIASVHYKFDPKSTIPHLAVITGTANGRVYYNDPAGKTPGQSLATTDFLKSWKKRFIVLRPQ